eukprot:g20281.t1
MSTGTTSDSEEDEVDFADGGQEQLQTPARSAASAAKAAVSDDAYGDHERESKLIMQKAMAMKLDWECYYWHSWILAKWFERGTNNMKSSAVSPALQRKQRTTCKWLPHTPKEKAKPLRGDLLDRR